MNGTSHIKKKIIYYQVINFFVDPSQPTRHSLKINFALIAVRYGNDLCDNLRMFYKKFSLNHLKFYYVICYKVKIWSYIESHYKNYIIPQLNCATENCCTF